MRLSEALQVIGQAEGDAQRTVHLVCGFSPLHVETFLKAYLIQRSSGVRVNVATGLYGDLEGNLQRARETGGDGAIAVVEWSDLDSRLGLRASAGWRAETLNDILVQVDERRERLKDGLARLAAVMPVAVAGPALALPPLSILPPTQSGDFELHLNVAVTMLLQQVAQYPAITVLSSGSLSLLSPAESRHDVKMELHAGFPYTLKHAEVLAHQSVQCLFPLPPKKGLITDLDQTLWKGILGDVGTDAVSWSLEGKSQVHALYQQLLSSLAESGVLVAIASKNDPTLVEEALKRSDLLVEPSKIFPVEASWGPKSEAVSRILKVWNIGADSVVLVDDSPMELAEVGEQFPGLECLRFPSDDPAAVVALLGQIRERFGKKRVLEEDRIRLQSIRNTAERPAEIAGEPTADFLARLGAVMTLEAASSDARAFELVNKTNQFNLNGLRYTDAEWNAISQRPDGFLLTVAYEDRFGPLGRIAVLGGYYTKDTCHVDIWVMSCRAFSRQIEFQSIRQLFAKTGAPEIRFRFKATDRNGPLQSFFASFSHGVELKDGELRLGAEDFDRQCPQLFHKVNDKWMT
ncbi:MAG TPA: HAD-IIIC family phosphatase [Terriglobales bacterium]|nr:HAD-IIIC family phosphatase [Terriglobales bacterium]